jgi:hypothetical protein
MNRNRNIIRDIIENWDLISFKNPILAHIWLLLPRFTLWQIWKEWNKRIFHSKASIPDLIWGQINKVIQETIYSKTWKQEDLKCDPEEECIFQQWQLSLNNHPVVNPSNHRRRSPIT